MDEIHIVVSGKEAKLLEAVLSIVSNLETGQKIGTDVVLQQERDFAGTLIHVMREQGLTVVNTSGSIIKTEGLFIRQRRQFYAGT